MLFFFYSFLFRGSIFLKNTVLPMIKRKLQLKVKFLEFFSFKFFALLIRLLVCLILYVKCNFVIYFYRQCQECFLLITFKNSRPKYWDSAAAPLIFKAALIYYRQIWQFSVATIFSTFCQSTVNISSSCLFKSYFRYLKIKILKKLGPGR